MSADGLNLVGMSANASGLAIAALNAAWSYRWGRDLATRYVPARPLPAVVCTAASFIPAALFALSGHLQSLTLAVVLSLGWLVFWVDSRAYKLPNQLTALIGGEVAAIWFVQAPPSGRLSVVAGAVVWFVFFWVTSGAAKGAGGSFRVGGSRGTRGRSSQVFCRGTQCGSSAVGLPARTGASRLGWGDLKLAPSLGATAAWQHQGGIWVGLVAATTVGALSGLTGLKRIPYGPPLLFGAICGAVL